MTICDDCFEEFLHPIVHESIEKNQQFDAKYGDHERWDWDDNAATLTFPNGGVAKLRIHVSVAGTTEGDQWEWSWANRNFKAHTKLDMEKVREYGEAKGFDKLTTAFLDADEYTGWAMTSVAVHVLNAPGSYRFPTDRGYCYLVYRTIEKLTSDDCAGASSPSSIQFPIGDPQ
jgi:hypothetical protein